MQMDSDYYNSTPHIRKHVKLVFCLMRHAVLKWIEWDSSRSEGERCSKTHLDVGFAYPWIDRTLLSVDIKYIWTLI